MGLASGIEKRNNCRLPTAGGGEGRVTALGPAATQQKRDDGADEEDEKENLGDAGGTGSDAEKAESRSNQRNDEEYRRIIKHESLAFRPDYLLNSQNAISAHSGNLTCRRRHFCRDAC
jgi:hypothetical protein